MFGLVKSAPERAKERENGGRQSVFLRTTTTGIISINKHLLRYHAQPLREGKSHILKSVLGVGLQVKTDLNLSTRNFYLFQF